MFRRQISHLSVYRQLYYRAFFLQLTTMAPKLYMVRASPAVRTVLITAKALGLSLDLKEVDLLNSEQLTPEYLKLNPQHTVPTLDDNGNVMWDSHAISTYLIGKYGKDDSLYPKDLYKRALVDQRLHFNSAVLYSLLRAIDYAYMKKEIKKLTQKMIEETKEAYGFLEKFSEGKQWVVLDRVTIADFSIYPTVLSLNVHVKIEPATYPNLSNWIKRVKALPCLEDDAGDQKDFEDFLNMFRG